MNCEVFVQMSDYITHNNLFVIIQLTKQDVHTGMGIEGSRDCPINI